MRKISANYLFPVNGAPVRNGYVVVDDNGTVVETGALEKECADTEFYNGILVPGFVNAHCHSELSYLKGYFRQATGMSGFIDQINKLRNVAPREERIGKIREAFEQMYSEGVSAMADICNCDESFEIKADSPLQTVSFIELFGTDPKEAGEIVEGGKRLRDKAKEMGLKAAVTPHACYTMSPELLEMASEEGLKDGTISYHSQESFQEEELLVSGTGALAENYRGRGLPTPPVTGDSALLYFIDRLLTFAKAPVEGRILLIHNVATNQKSIERALAALKEPYWVLCPLSNIFIHRQLPPVEMMVENNLKLCIGTDSLSSNTVLSIVEEMKCLQKNFSRITLLQMVEWATLNGARALGMEKRLGSIEKGKQPGIVLIDNIDWNNFALTGESRSRRLV